MLFREKCSTILEEDGNPSEVHSKNVSNSVESKVDNNAENNVPKTQGEIMEKMNELNEVNSKRKSCEITFANKIVLLSIVTMLCLQLFVLHRSVQTVTVCEQEVAAIENKRITKTIGRIFGNNSKDRSNIYDFQTAILAFKEKENENTRIAVVSLGLFLAHISRLAAVCNHSFTLCSIHLFSTVILITIQTSQLLSQHLSHEQMSPFLQMLYRKSSTLHLCRVPFLLHKMQLLALSIFNFIHVALHTVFIFRLYSIKVRPIHWFAIFHNNSQP